MKKILGVMGSPRKGGNTDILLAKVLEGARIEGATANIIRLGDLSIKECDGCHACWKSKPCSKHDDMRGIYPEIIQSDLIIFGTPVYWYGPTALMKGFIDRLTYFNCPENHRQIRGKKAVIIIPYEENKAEVVEPVIDFFEQCCKYLELKLVQRLIAPGVTRRGEVAYNPEVMEQALQLGRMILQK